MGKKQHSPVLAVVITVSAYLWGQLGCGDKCQLPLHMELKSRSWRQSSHFTAEVTVCCCDFRTWPRAVCGLHSLAWAHLHLSLVSGCPCDETAGPGVCSFLGSLASWPACPHPCRRYGRVHSLRPSCQWSSVPPCCRFLCHLPTAEGCEGLVLSLINDSFSSFGPDFTFGGWCRADLRDTVGCSVPRVVPCSSGSVRTHSLEAPIICRALAPGGIGKDWSGLLCSGLRGAAFRPA